MPRARTATLIGSGMRPGLASLPSGSTARPRKKLKTPTGRLMKNAHRQLRLDTTSAPRVGPKAPAAAPIAPQMATATGTLSRGNVCSTRASDAGTRIAAPAASTISAPTSTPTVGASPRSIEPTVNTTTPIRNIRRRPTRSARRPLGISSAANTRVYALSTHDTVDGPAELNVLLIAGNETKPIVVSRNTANTARLVDVSTIHGL